jgi:hypothetical protein
MLARNETKLLSGGIDPVAGESTGRFADVILGIMSDPEGEQLHDFTRPVFVRVLFFAQLQIEVSHHRGIARDLL